MGFADPSVCPSCGGRLDAVTRCPHCGIDLTSHEVRQAWQALVVADQWLDRARGMQAAGTPTTTPPVQPPMQAAPRAAPTVAPPPQRRSLSAGSVLLGLGAIFLLVAGSIFISVSWGSLGILGRALVLLAVTALMGTIGWFVTRRGLRASSEAMWTVFFGLLTLDWFAARDQGLAGLDEWPFGASAAAWGALVIAATIAVVRMGRARLNVELLAPSIIAGSAALFAAGSLAAEIDSNDTLFWPAVLATGVAAAAAAAMRWGTARVGAWIAIAGAGLFGLFAIGAAVAETIDYPTLRELVVDRHGLPLLLVVVVAIASGLLVSRTRWAASAIAVAGAATLITTPIEAAWPERGAFVTVSVLLAAGAWVPARASDWLRGLRLAVGLGAIGLALAASPWIARLLAVMAEGASASRTDVLTTRLSPDVAPETGPGWLVVVVAVGLALALVGAGRWPEIGPARAHLAPAAWITGVVGGLSLTATLDPAAAVLGGAVVAAGLLLAVALRNADLGWRWVGTAVVVVAPLTTLSSWPASVIVWPVAGLVLAAVAIRTQDEVVRCGSAFAATFWGLGTIAVAVELVDGDDRWTALALVVAGLVGLTIGLLAVRDQLAHLSVEAAAAVLGLAGLAMGSVDSTLGFASFIWTAAGAGVVVLGLLPRRRAWYRWIGSALLGTAYVLRLAASDVEVVEAYTLPFAALLLVAGLWAMRDEEGPSSVRALLPGVVLALVPSLPQALDEPTSLRALLLGIGAAAALAVGTWRRWQVPFVAGAIVLTLLVLVNVGPYAVALPRWVLIASVGAVLLAAGITWEDRVRDGRAAIRYVGSMR